MTLRSRETYCTCSNWPKRANDPFFPIWLNTETNEYVMFFGDSASGALVIHYCPSCGGKMPRSHRGDHFVIPSVEELKEARLLLESISDITTMRSVLGEPDDVFEWFRDEEGNLLPNPDVPGFVRQYRYLSRWTTLQLSIQETENGQLRFYFSGQPKIHEN